jgi:hypothetical protein
MVRYFFILYLLLLSLPLSAQYDYPIETDILPIVVDYTRSPGGGYDVNPFDENQGQSSEIYTIYAVQQSWEADSIVHVEHNVGFEDATIDNQTLTFSATGVPDFVDYFVLVVTRGYNEVTNYYYTLFAEGDSVLVKSNNSYSFAKLPMRDFQTDQMDDWFGEFGRFCTVDTLYEDGEMYREVHFNYASNPGYPDWERPFVCALGPTTLLALWDDSLDSESGYELQYRKWLEDQNDWANPLTITLPENKSGYCINNLEPETAYWVICYPLGVSDVDTLKCLIATYSNEDITETESLHYLPYYPITSAATGNGILAYTFVTGYGKESRDCYYDYVLIKRQSGSFTVVEVNRSELPDDFFMTDVAIHDRSVFVSHDQGDVMEVSMPDAHTTVTSNVGLDLSGGFVKEMKTADDRIYMAIKYPQAIPGGNQPALGIYTPGSGALETHSHPDILGGGDQIAVDENWVYLAENIPVGGGQCTSFIVRFDRNGELQAPFITPLGHLSARAGIIDMTVNPVTGELVYLSPEYGLYGCYGTSYNDELTPPADYTGTEPVELLCTADGAFVLTHPGQVRTAATADVYNAVTAGQEVVWSESDYFGTDASLAMMGFGPGAKTFGLPLPTAQLIVGGLVFTGTAVCMGMLVSTIAQTEISLATFNLGVAEQVIEKQKTREDVWDDVDIDELLNKIKKWMEKGTLLDPDPLPTPLPIPLPWPLPQPRIAPPKTDTEPDPCEIDTPWFQAEFFSWDDYYSRITRGQYPFDNMTTANQECIGAHFSKFVLAFETTDQGGGWKCFVSEPLTYENRHKHSLTWIKDLFLSKPECYDQAYSGWISFGPWMRIQTDGSDLQNYFLITDDSFGNETDFKGTEKLSAFGLYAWEDFIAGNPSLNSTIFYLPSISNSDFMLRYNQIYHRNMPAPCPEFADRSMKLKPMHKDYWSLDGNGRKIDKIKYFNPNEQLNYKYHIIPEYGKLVHVNSGAIHGAAAPVAQAKYVLGCDEKLYTDLWDLEYLSDDWFAWANFHSQFLAGAAVQGAGEIRLRRGTPVSINNQSGHYLPGEIYLNNVLHYFEANGFSEKRREYKEYLVTVFLDESYAQTTSSTRHVDINATTGLQLTAQLYHASSSTYASDLWMTTPNGLTLNADDPGSEETESLTSIESTTHPFYTFILPVNELKARGAFSVQGTAGSDTCLHILSFDVFNLATSDRDTFGLHPEYVHWVPEADIGSNDQLVVIHEDDLETLDEDPSLIRHNYLFHITSTQPPQGTLRFYYVNKESDPERNTSVYRQSANGEWLVIPSQLDDTETFIEAEIDANGVYGLFAPDPEANYVECGLSVRAFLQGAFDSEGAQMSNALVHVGSHPL